MPSVTRSFTFDVSAQGFVALNFGGWTGADGDPAPGCLEDSGVLPAFGASFAAGMSWADWGLPAGATITLVDCSVRWKVVSYSSGATHDKRLTVRLSTDFQNYNILQTDHANVTPGDWATDAITGSNQFQFTQETAPEFAPNIYLDPLDGVGYTTVARFDTLVFEIHYTMPTQLRRVSAGPVSNYFLMFEEGDDMICRKALLKAYSQYTTQSGEKAWAYQLIRNYCADWIEISVGAIIDPSAAAGAKVLNGNFGVRVWNCAIGKDANWLVNTSGVAIGNGLCIPFPAWQSPVLIPWMAQSVNVLVEFYTSDTIPANSTIELGIAPIQEGA